VTMTVSRELISVDDLETPYWARIDRSAVEARMGRMHTAVPRVVLATVRRAWQASPLLAAGAAALQLASGVVTAFGLLATADVFTRLLAEGPSAERLVAALPALALVVGAYAARGLLESATTLIQAVLEPRVEHREQDDFLSAVLGIELVAFDDADFMDLVIRARAVGLSHVRSATAAVASLLGSIVSLAAAVVTAGLLHPVLAPVVLLTVLPQGWASVRAARMMYQSYLETNTRARKRDVTAMLMTSRGDAAEVRAFTAQKVLLGEHRRIAAGLMDEAISVQRRTTGVRLVGRTLAGVGSAAAYLVLGLLIYSGSLALALAGAAALALRTATSALSSAVYSTNRLYESSFYLDLFDRCRADATERTRRAAGELPEGSDTPARTGARSPRSPCRCRPGRWWPWWGRTVRASPRWPRCSPGCTYPSRAPCGGMASTSPMSIRGRCRARSPSSCRTPPSGRRQRRTTSGSGGSSGRTRTVSRCTPQPCAPAPTPSWTSYPIGGPPCCRGSSRTGVTCPAGSGSGSAWLEGCTGTRRSSSPTNRPRRWTPALSTQSSPTCAA